MDVAIDFLKTLLPSPVAPVYGGDPKKWFPLADKYKDFETSGLTVTVSGGVNHRDIPLTGDKRADDGILPN